MNMDIGTPTPAELDGDELDADTFERLGLDRHSFGDVEDALREYAAVEDRLTRNYGTVTADDEALLSRLGPLVERIREEPVNFDHSRRWTGHDGLDLYEAFAERERVRADITEGRVAYEGLAVLMAVNEIDDALGGTLDGQAAASQRYAVTEHKFEEFAREWAYDMGDVERDSVADAHMNWESYAASVRNDFQEFEFDGTTYLIRQI